MTKPFVYNYSSDEYTGKVTWRCPSNIALVKYWGKRERQLPSNPSLSFSLSECVTETSIEYEFIEATTSPAVHLLFNGQPNLKFQQRVKEFVENLILDIPDISHLRMNINTKNTFPHSSGIASSASAFGSIALCLCSIEEKLAGSISGSLDFYQKASYLARLGSGSGCRSVYGGYTVWGDSEFYSEFTNLYAIPLPFEVHPEFSELCDTILVVSSIEKKLSSTDGHALMKGHPFAMGRYSQAQKNLNSIITALRTGDSDLFVNIVENEALSLHALIMSSGLGNVLMKPSTIAIMEQVTNFRNSNKIPVCFTLDAGPNVHLIYPNKYKDKLIPFVESDLKPLCENNYFIDDCIGKGPEKF